MGRPEGGPDTLAPVPGGSFRIALVVERFEPRGGGVEGVAWNVAHGLAAAGDEVWVFARRAEAPARGRGAGAAVSAPISWKPIRTLLFSARCARATRAARCDLVHSFSRTRHQDVYRAGGGSHAAYMERAYGPPGRGCGVSRRATRCCSASRARVFADPRQTIQCNSLMVRDELRARHGVPDARLRVVWNGVDLERFRPERRAAERERVRAELGAPPEPRSGCSSAPSSTARASTRRCAPSPAAAPATPSCGSAAATGRRPWRALAERLGVLARVRFLGARADVERLYAAADALILPTRYDAFANVCLEAAASGLPVLTSGANGAAAFLGSAGLVVEEPEDAAGFAKALDALADPALRARLGAAARARAEERSWERHVAELRALYAQLR